MLEIKYIIFFSVLIFINLLFVIKYNSIAKIYKLYDIPNSARKFHKLPVPLIGGLIVLSNIVLFIGFEFFFINKVYLPGTYYLDNLFLTSNKSIASFLFCLVFLFLLGYFDDKYDLDPFKKLIVLFIIFYVFFSLDDSLVINELNLTFITYSIDISEVGFFFSLLISLIFLNSINMYDGINGQVGFLSLTIFIFFLLNNFMPMLSVLLIISLLFFLFLNLKGKIFMGDSGCYILSFILTYFFLRFYNFGLIKLDEAFLFFFLPIVDTLRLFVIRIFTSGQPWKADANHMHHLISNKFNLNFALLSQYILSLCLILLVVFTDINNLFLILLATIIYFICLFKFRKN